jgi:hypothetical protein
MAISDTVLQQDIQWVASSTPLCNFTYTVEVHCGTSRNIRPLKMISIDTIADFEKGFADELVLSAMFVRSDYEQYIYPNRDVLQITVVRTPIGVVTDSVDTGKSPQAQVFKATLVNPVNQTIAIGDGGYSGNDKYTNLTLMELDFQLLELPVEQLMMMTVGGIYRKTTPAAVLKSALTQFCHNLQGLDTSSQIVGVDMYPVPVPQGQSAPKVREHIIIPHGTRLVCLADHIQEKEGGIYDTGIGCYYRKNNMYVCPPYDVTRFQKVKRTMTILIVKSAEMPGMDCTYRVDGDAVTIVANGSFKHLDGVDHTAVNQGGGARFAKAQSLLDGFTDGTSKGEANSQKVMAGFVANARDDGKNYVPFSQNRITDNAPHELSKLAQRAGQRVQLNWQRADISLILPYMPVRLLYESGGLLYEFTGTVLNCQGNVHPDQPGMTASRYYQDVAMTLFLTVTKTMKA